jgi:hypothetical protein
MLLKEMPSVRTRAAIVSTPVWRWLQVCKMYASGCCFDVCHRLDIRHSLNPDFHDVLCVPLLSERKIGSRLRPKLEADVSGVQDWTVSIVV